MILWMLLSVVILSFFGVGNMPRRPTIWELIDENQKQEIERLKNKNLKH